MPGRLLLSLGRVFFDQAATWRLFAFSVAGYAFSLAVILCTLGLMDGFEVKLKEGLRSAAGDALLTHRNGFFSTSPALMEELSVQGMRAMTGVVQSEAFALVEERSQGVLARGVEPGEFGTVTGMRLSLSPDGIVIGQTLADEWSLREGDRLNLVLARGHDSERPQFLELQVQGIVRHHIHEKDARYVYVTRSRLQEALGLGDKVNMALLSLHAPLGEIKKLEEKIASMADGLGNPWVLKPAWQEFSSLLEAVEVEKTTIAIILQLIVVVAVFNVAAFLVTLQARKTREFFLLRTLGLPRSRFFLFATLMLLSMWLMSCLGALTLVQIFNWMLAHVSWLQVPGDIYVLSRLQVLLSTKDYLWVFGAALLWMALLGSYAAHRMRRQSLLTGLRQEFQ